MKNPPARAGHSGLLRTQIIAWSVRREIPSDYFVSLLVRQVAVYREYEPAVVLG